MNKTLDTPYVYYELHDDDMLFATYKKDIKITLEAAKEIVKARLAFTMNRPVVNLVYNAGVISFDKQARDYLASDAGVEGIIAGAIIQKQYSPVGVFFINFYLSVAKPKVPARFFLKKEAALSWLEKQRAIFRNRK